MAVLEVRCYGSLANDGNYQIPNNHLGNISIDITSETNSEQLPVGTRFVLLSTDALEKAYFTFGKDSAIATTSHDYIDGGKLEQPRYIGINNKNNNTIAAVTA